MIQRGLIGDLFTLTRSVIETGAGKYKPLLTLCDALLRMFAGLFADPVDILAIPEVLIGEISFRVDHKNYTNLRIMCRFFFALTPICNSNR